MTDKLIFFVFFFIRRCEGLNVNIGSMVKNAGDGRFSVTACIATPVMFKYLRYT
jgi:hypothetical protein